eukprot:Hpha_TRINITY_DN11943_c0_g1::TRINITY_DN11943_c0_g1_i1::g.20705::m.20705
MQFSSCCLQPPLFSPLLSLSFPFLSVKKMAHFGFKGWRVKGCMRRTVVGGLGSGGGVEKMKMKKKKERDSLKQHQYPTWAGKYWRGGEGERKGGRDRTPAVGVTERSAVHLVPPAPPPATLPMPRGAPGSFLLFISPVQNCVIDDYGHFVVGSTSPPPYPHPFVVSHVY